MMTETQMIDELLRRFRDYESLELWVHEELNLRLRVDGPGPEAGLRVVIYKLVERAIGNGQLLKTIESKLMASGGAFLVIPEMVNRARQWREFDTHYHGQLASNRPQIYVLACLPADAPDAFGRRVRHFLAQQASESTRTAGRPSAIVTLSDIGALEELQADYKSSLFQNLSVSLEAAKDRSATELLNGSHLAGLHHVVVEMVVPADDFGEAVHEGAEVLQTGDGDGERAVEVAPVVGL